MVQERCLRWATIHGGSYASHIQPIVVAPRMLRNKTARCLEAGLQLDDTLNAPRFFQGCHNRMLYVKILECDSAASNRVLARQLEDNMDSYRRYRLQGPRFHNVNCLAVWRRRFP
mmetsp:Transcript_36608/g.79212  ORF Transcript_36608/g.79212 Transcript_36608/m.79212 type:complete len:115 (+) Transcript_36608:169-513(+)